MKTIDDFYPPISDQKSIEQTDTFSGNEIESIKNAAFKAGVQFAEEWIDVNEELPERSGDNWYSDSVLVKRTDDYCVAYYHYTYRGWYDSCTDDGIYVSKWRPINRK